MGDAALGIVAAAVLGGLAVWLGWLGRKFYREEIPGSPVNGVEAGKKMIGCAIGLGVLAILVTVGTVVFLLPE